MSNPIPQRLQMRFGTSQQWLANPVLAKGEPGYNLDTKELKIGDGLTPWLALEADTSVFRGLFVAGTIYQLGQYVEAADGGVYVARRRMVAVAQPVAGMNWRKTSWGAAVAALPTRQQIFDYLEAGPGVSITLTTHNTILISLTGTTPPAAGNGYVQAGYVAANYVD